MRLLDTVVNDEKIAQILQAGAWYGGAGWTTARASHALFTLTGLCVHSKDFADFRQVWLLDLALYWGTELPDAPMIANAVQAAPALAAAMHGEDGDEEVEEEDLGHRL